MLKWKYPIKFHEPSTFKIQNPKSKFKFKFKDKINFKFKNKILNDVGAPCITSVLWIWPIFCNESFIFNSCLVTKEGNEWMRSIP